MKTDHRVPGLWGNNPGLGTGSTWRVEIRSRVSSDEPTNSRQRKSNHDINQHNHQNRCKGKGLGGASGPVCTIDNEPDDEKRKGENRSSTNNIVHPVMPTKFTIKTSYQKDHKTIQT